MPPRKKQSSTKVKKEDVDQRRRILLAQEKVLATKRLQLSIVETMIERNVSKKWFIENCSKLCHADYDDVVQERSIEHMCGYPMCSNIIKETLKQKYQISLATNKVYDLTERKYYCSNNCYKASKYLKAQLSPIPLYMRKEETIKIHLLSDCDNRGSAGEEVVFHHAISREEIEKEEIDTVEHISNNMHKILNEEIKKCADSLNNLQIKEHVFDEQFVFKNETPKKADNSMSDEKSDSDSENDPDSEEDDNEKLFPSYDNVEVLSVKHMPVPKNIKKSILIPPLKAEASPSLVKAPLQQLSIDFVYKVLIDWMTEATMKYLFGEKYVYGLKADHILKRMTSTEPICSDKLQSLKEEYINLSLKIDKLPDDEDVEEDDFEDYVELGILSEPKSNTVSKTLNKYSEDKKVFKRRPKDKSKSKDKQVSFVPEVETSIQKDVDLNDLENVSIDVEDEVSEEPAFPLVDSLAQNVLRRQVVTNHLKSVYTDLLPVIGIHYVDIREAIRKFVGTLSLTPTNIVFKPNEWKLISLILYRILTKTVMKKFLNELQFLRLCEDSSMPVNIDVLKLEKIVSDILSPDNIMSIK